MVEGLLSTGPTPSSFNRYNALYSIFKGLFFFYMSYGGRVDYTRREFSVVFTQLFPSSAGQGRNSASHKKTQGARLASDLI